MKLQDKNIANTLSEIESHINNFETGVAYSSAASGAINKVAIKTLQANKHLLTEALTPAMRYAAGQGVKGQKVDQSKLLYNKVHQLKNRLERTINNHVQDRWSQNLRNYDARFNGLEIMKDFLSSAVKESIDAALNDGSNKENTQPNQ